MMQYFRFCKSTESSYYKTSRNAGITFRVKVEKNELSVKILVRKTNNGRCEL